MNFIGFSNKDFPSIPPVFCMGAGEGKFVLLLENSRQPWNEGTLLAGDVDRHALLVALHFDLVSGLRVDMKYSDMDGVVLQRALSVGRGLVLAAGRYYFSVDHVCHIVWGSQGYSVNLHGAPLDPPGLAEAVKETLTNGLKNDPRLWAKAG